MKLNSLGTCDGGLICIDPTTNLLMSQSLAVEADRRGESPLRTIEGKQLIHIASIHIVYDPVCPHTLLLGVCIMVLYA